MNRVHRRSFLTLVGASAAAWPVAARTQQRTVPLIGFLGAGSAWEDAPLAAAFRAGLSETGYVEDRNVTIDYRWAEGHYDRLPILAAELVRRQVRVIAATGGSISALAARGATTTIPIVFHLGVDPVEMGLVVSLNRPGGNLTGVSNMSNELVPKRLELMREANPLATVIAILINPSNPNAEADTRRAQQAARILGVQIEVLHAATEHEIDATFSKLTQSQVGGLVIGPDGFFLSRSERLAALMVRHGVPAIFQTREFAAAGGLMSYGANTAEAIRLAGVYAGRILKGEKPADLPVIQPTKFDLVINLKTAKALGLTLPLTLQVAATEVIE
jgi:putative ABC transport system substrate-binding protein